MSDEKDCNNIARILKKIPARQVIWILLLALIGSVIFIGQGYADRLGKLEIVHEKQNGQVSDMAKDVKALVGAVEGMATEQGKQRTAVEAIGKEQAVQKAHIEWIKETLRNR